MIVLSKLADYGVIVATHLATEPERQLTAVAVATETRLPQATVAKVLKSLAHAGVVTALRGAAGGYRLARPPGAISVAEVVAAIDGAIGMTQCAGHDGAIRDDIMLSCERESFCPTRPHWRRINLAIGAALASVSLAEMASDRIAAPVRRTTQFLENAVS
jgi:FeS assembly SUF system regulator